MKLNLLAESPFLFGSEETNATEYIYNNLIHEYRGEPLEIIKTRQGVLVDVPGRDRGICRFDAVDEALQVWNLLGGDKEWLEHNELETSL